MRVIDAASFIAGPVATTIMADLGADLIKIEPPDGDPYRNAPRSRRRREPLQLSLDHRQPTKRRLALDLRQPAGRAVSIAGRARRTCSGQHAARLAGAARIAGRPGAAQPAPVYASMTGVRRAR